MPDTTSTKRQARRRTALNKIAQDAGFATWTRFETETIRKGEIMNARNVTPEDWINYLVQINAFGSEKEYVKHLMNMSPSAIGQELSEQPVDTPAVYDLIIWAQKHK